MQFEPRELAMRTNFDLNDPHLGAFVPEDSPTIPVFDSLSEQVFSSNLSPRQSQYQSQSRQDQGNPLDALANAAGIRRGQKKRACNDCRQQKLRCDLIFKNPPEACSRCTKLHIECRVDDRFKRTRKRKKVAEMEKEMDELKRKLSSYAPPGGQNSVAVGNGDSIQHFNTAHQSFSFSTTLPNGTSEGAVYYGHPSTTTRPGIDAPEDQARQDHPIGSMSNLTRRPRTLNDVTLSSEQIDELFSIYFSHYHHFLPVLDPMLSAQEYFEASHLLFWCICSVASRRYELDPTLLTRLARAVTNLTWKSLQTIPHSKNVVQSLVLLCTWPFPTSSTTTDVTYMWVGMIMQTSIQMGIHRPMNPQDFTKFRIKLTDNEVTERLRTWAACNIVAQSASIGVGLNAPTSYDWNLVFAAQTGSQFKLPDDLDFHLKIEMFCDHVSRSMSSNVSDPVGLSSTRERSLLYRLLDKELENLEGSAGVLSDINRFYLLGAKLHLHAFHLYDEASSDGYDERIITLYLTASSLVQHSLDIESRTRSFFPHVPFFAYQSFMCASFVLLKILKNRYFKAFVDADAGTRLFNSTITAIRKMSVANNDLPGRLGDVLAYLWSEAKGTVISGAGQDGLQLKIRSRMSMSVVYDSLWRWREQYEDRTEDEVEEVEETPVFEESPMTALGSVLAEGAPVFDTFGSLDWILDAVDLPMDQAVSLQ